MKKLFSIVLLAFAAFSATAMPEAQKASRLLTLDDGTEVYTELKGNHLCHYWQAEDGRCFVALGDDQYQEQPRQVLEQRAAQVNLRQIKSRPAASRKNGLGGDHIEYTGLKKGLILLVEFQNMGFKPSHDITFFKRMANEVGFTDPVGFVGSVKDYFLAQSNGLFELDFDVVGPLKVSQNYEYYGKNGSNGQDLHPVDMVIEALELADSQVNYADYDWDGDGMVEQVYVLYAGMGEAAGGDENTIWPHESSLAGWTGNTYKYDGVEMDTYACGSEILFSVVYNRITGKSQVYQRTGGIGTLCHEFTHCLGIPDFYDTRGTNLPGTGDFDLMCSGSYNENSFRPPYYTALERIYAGWKEPIELKEPTTVVGMKPASDNGDVFIIYNDAHQDEYYLLENRQQKGWDKALPAAGLMITHVDYEPSVWEYNIVNSKYTYSWRNEVYATNDHERYALFRPNYVNGDWAARDALYPCTINGELRNALTNDSDPAAILYNANTDGSFFMNKPITNIVQNADGTISFDFMGGSQSNIINGMTPAIATQPANVDNSIYDLQGRRVASPQKRGIYVRNGRKVIL